eukprot:4138799-Amphidinium_carterae.1
MAMQRAPLEHLLHPKPEDTRTSNKHGMPMNAFIRRGIGPMTHCNLDICRLHCWRTPCNEALRGQNASAMDDDALLSSAYTARRNC